MKGAVEFHVEGLREDGLPIPPPSSIAAYAEWLQCCAACDDGKGMSGSFGDYGGLSS